jgi:hypothetical protein
MIWESSNLLNLSVRELTTTFSQNPDWVIREKSRRARHTKGDNQISLTRKKEVVNPELFNLSDNKKIRFRIFTGIIEFQLMSETPGFVELVRCLCYRRYLELRVGLVKT